VNQHRDASDPTPADQREVLYRNLDTEHRRLAEAEAVARKMLAGHEPDLTSLADSVDDERQSYEQLTASNDRLRGELNWDHVDLDAALTPTQLEVLDTWRRSRRLQWSTADLAVVGLAGVVGVMASVLDDHLDAQMRQLLGRLKQTDLLRGWEADARRMPIDYTGPNFGGPDHRVRSAGHDLGRPLSALRQIRDGRFRGIVWSDGVRTVFATEPGRYVPVDALGEALTLWGKHLVADFVTPMSLPLPGWTWLYELPDRDVRKFAHAVYHGSELGGGLNLRSGGLNPMLSFLSTEMIVRTHVHARTYRRTGSPRLSSQEAALCTELLLAGHAVVGAACLGRALLAAFAGEGPLALRHVNLAVLVRVGFLAARVRADALDRAALRPTSWDDLLACAAAPWQLDDAARIDAEVEIAA